jgi:hypothetical protein
MVVAVPVVTIAQQERQVAQILGVVVEVLALR